MHLRYWILPHSRVETTGICLGGEEQQVYITTKRRCGKGSVAALLFGVYYKNVLK